MINCRSWGGAALAQWRPPIRFVPVHSFFVEPISIEGSAVLVNGMAGLGQVTKLFLVHLFVAIKAFSLDSAIYQSH